MGHNAHDRHADSSDRRRMSPGHYWICSLILITAVGYYVWTEHRPHVGEILFWIVVLACPIIHLFMHRKHGQDHGVD